jgi:hypothetical protein
MILMLFIEWKIGLNRVEFPQKAPEFDVHYAHSRHGSEPLFHAASFYC